MAEDAAFVWDSTTPRPARPAGPPEAIRPPEATRPPARWVSLRAAEQAIGVPAATIRNWARKGRIPSRVEERDGERRRLVEIGAARERARSLGRLDEAAPPPATGQAEPVPPPAPVPDDHVLVPLDAWEKVLLQLGNLHTAGQELAEARERAAKAETEAQFLRERLAEMRPSPTPEPSLPQPIEPPDADLPLRRAASHYRAFVARLRRRR